MGIKLNSNYKLCCSVSIKLTFDLADRRYLGYYFKLNSNSNSKTCQTLGNSLPGAIKGNVGSLCVEGGVIKNAERDLLNVNYVVIASTRAKTCNSAQFRKKSLTLQEMVLISLLPFLMGNLLCFAYRRFQ